MCRFLLVRSKNKFKPEKLLRQFSLMCQKSRAPDGDWQGDGWGIALRQSSGQAQIKDLSRAKPRDQKWEVYKSLKPIWEESDKFKQFGETDIFIVHARSAGFPQHKGIIEFNQPYVSDLLCFVFNGMIRGVKLTIPLEGKIGAQKIFSLIRQQLKNAKTEETLHTINEMLVNNAKEIEGMNIGLANKDRLYALCEYADNGEYFGLRYYSDSSIAIICSQPIGNFAWKKMKKGEVINL